MNSSVIDAIKKVNDISFNDGSKFIEIDKTESYSERKTETKDRSKLTSYFIWGFFALLVWSFLFVLFYNWVAVGWAIDLQKNGMAEAANKVSLLELDKVLSIIITALGTSLGFIIGYYFKEKRSA